MEEQVSGVKTLRDGDSLDSRFARELSREAWDAKTSGMRDVISRKTGPDVDCIPNDAFTIAIAIYPRWMGLRLPYELDNISVYPQVSP